MVDRLRILFNRPLQRRRPPAAVRDRRRRDRRGRRHPRAARRRRPRARHEARHARRPTSAPAGAAEPIVPASTPVAPSEESDPPPGLRARAADVARSKRAARRFLAGYLPFTYGRGPAASHPLGDRGAARRARPLAPARPGVRAPPPRRALELLQSNGVSRERADLVALVRDGERRYSVRLELANTPTRLAGHRPRSAEPCPRPPSRSPAPRCATRARTRRVLLDRRRASSASGSFVLIGVLGAIFGLQPLQRRLRPVRGGDRARSRRSTSSSTSRPAQRYGIDPWILAAIGTIETDHGRSTAPGVRSGVNTYGCCAGPMQFSVIGSPSTWDGYGVDGNHDGRKIPLRPGRRDPRRRPLPARLRRPGRLPPRDLRLQPRRLVRRRGPRPGRRLPRRRHRTPSTSSPIDTATVRELLANPRIVLTPGQRADLRAGGIDPRLLSTLAWIGAPPHA